MTKLFDPFSGRFQNGQFQRVPTEDLHKSWVACFNGGRRSRLVHKVSWRSPPKGIFKLKFDGSFVHQICIGGIGSVIRD